MGVIFHTETKPDLYYYKPEFNLDGTEKHIVCDGARFHVVSYSTEGRRCSCENCEINKETK